MGPGGSTLQTLVTSIWVGIGKIENCFVFTLVLKRTLSYLRFLKAGKKKKKKGPFVFSCPRRQTRVFGGWWWLFQGGVCPWPGLSSGGPRASQGGRAPDRYLVAAGEAAPVPGPVLGTVAF